MALLAAAASTEKTAINVPHAQKKSECGGSARAINVSVVDTGLAWLNEAGKRLKQSISALTHFPTTMGLVDSFGNAVVCAAAWLFYCGALP